MFLSGLDMEVDITSLISTVVVAFQRGRAVFPEGSESEAEGDLARTNQAFYSIH